MNGKKILVVDDDEGILEAFEAVLESADYTVIKTTSPDMLFDMTSENLPDLILLDVLLSGVDGREVCQKLKSNKTTEHIPVIIVSAHPGADKSTKEVGADDFIAKPFEMDELLSKIARLLPASH